MTYLDDNAVRRLRRKVSFWRVVAGLALVGIAAILLLPGDGPGRAHVARLTVSGLIVQDEDRNRALRDLTKSGARALIVHIDSPGGTVVGGEDLYRHLEAVRAEMPVAAVMGTVAASGGYMAALPADRIFARAGTLTGSIGVLLQTTDMTELLGRIGVSAEAIKSSPLKAQPSPLEPLTEEGRGALQAVIDDMYEFFIGLVAERRPMDRAAARRLADGRVYTGRQALGVGLIDEIGGETAALDWLAAERRIDRNLPVIDLVIDRDRGLLDRLIGRLVGKSLFSNAITLDGLVSLWQPEAP